MSIYKIGINSPNQVLSLGRAGAQGVKGDSMTAAYVDASSGDFIMEFSDGTTTNLGTGNYVSQVQLNSKNYLGSHTTEPSLDNDGNALIDGALFYNTTINELGVYDLANTTWIYLAVDAANSASAAATSETNAATSETNAAASATSATNSATSAATSETNAATSETNAASSEANAATSETNAASSETNAATSETNAATSETNAATSATNAATSETNAATSETNAAASATNAATSETNAATSETNAATSETNAASSEGNAGTSENNAATSEANAATSETNAASSETNAATSETNAAASATSAANSAASAASSESNAATSETNAATSETNAASSETNAATSETNASTHATSAATSATNAQTSADTALAALDSFDDRYLGQKASDPTTDNDGDALVSGALYFNTTTDEMKVYDAGNSVWLAAYASLAGVLLQANDLSDLSDVATARSNLGLATSDSPTFANVVTAGNVDGRDVSADGTKLDTVETNADVTDTANVTTAGALMDSELTAIASVKALDQGVASTDDPLFNSIDVTDKELTRENINVDVAGTALSLAIAFS